MTRYLSALGFSGHRVTRPIIGHGITTGDTVVLIHPADDVESDDDRRTAAIRDVESMLSGVVHSVATTEVPVPTDDFPAVVRTCSQHITKGSPPVVCLGAGPTDVLLPLTVATLAHPDSVADVMLYSDVQQTAINPPLPDLTARIPARASETFATIAEATQDDTSVSIEQVAELTDVSESTASRHVKALEQVGLLYSERVEREKRVSLTLTGQLIHR